MTYIYLIRHAEAEGNLYRRAQGQFNGHITELGRRQIAALAERFRDIPIDAVYSSDLSRTRETAGAILKYHELPLQIDPLLREICMGTWEDVAWGDLERDHSQQMLYFARDPDKWSIPGGESFKRLTERITSEILKIAAANEGRTVAVLCHGMAIRSFIAGVKGIRSEDISSIPHGDNTSVCHLTVSDGVIDILSYNDASHLGPELSTFSRQLWWRSKNGDGHNLHFLPLDLRVEAKLYTDVYADAWRCSHGDLTGFTPDYYLRTARAHASEYSNSLMKAMERDELAGLLELDTRRCSDIGVGWISLIWVTPEKRGLRFGIQLIGQAAATYRQLKRSRLQLHVAISNTAAIGFYERYGFNRVGSEPGSVGELLLMEKELEL